MRFPAFWVAFTVFAASRPTPFIVFAHEASASITKHVAVMAETCFISFVLGKEASSACSRSLFAGQIAKGPARERRAFTPAI